MKISVVIPTKDRCGHLGETVKSLVRQSTPVDELIIVDQSNAPCREMIMGILKDSEIESKYICDTSIKGPVPARKSGFMRSSGEIIFFVDDDITLENDCVKNLLATYIKYPSLGGIGAVDLESSTTSHLRVLMRRVFFRGPFHDARDWANKFYYRFDGPIRTNFFSGGYMSFRREVVEEIKFDEVLNFHSFVGDIDISFRASRKYNLAIAPTVRIHHRERRSELYSSRKAYEMRLFSRAWFFRKNVKKNLIAYFCCLWVILGTGLSASREAIGERTLEPLKGFFTGFKHVRLIF